MTESNLQSSGNTAQGARWTMRNGSAFQQTEWHRVCLM